MKRFGIALMLLALSLSALPVFANQVQLTLTGTGGNASGGVYTYPYDFTVSSTNPVSSTNNVPLMCDSFLNEVAIGETWKANMYSISSAGTVGGMYAGDNFTLPSTLSGISTTPATYYTSQQAYDAAGLIYLASLGEGPLAGMVGTLSSGLANWAIWDLFDPGITDLYGARPFSLYTLASLDIMALNDLSLYTPAGLANVLADVVVYTPVNGSQSCGGEPQEYIGIVPEPSSLLLMGSGLMGLAGFARRRFSK